MIAILAGVGILIVGWGAGVWMGALWSDHDFVGTKARHRDEMDVIYEEVRRLRAQVANLIGQE